MVQRAKNVMFPYEDTGSQELCTIIDSFLHFVIILFVYHHSFDHMFRHVYIWSVALSDVFINIF